jgi:hypothetical protein
VELERSLEKFRQQGRGVVAISYDSEQILRHFSDRLGGFHYPLLADPESTIIGDFGILNDKVPESHPWYGICFPGTYIVDRNGVVQTKFFEQLHTQRVTADTVLVKEFGQDGGRRLEAKTDHLVLTASASQDAVRPGNRLTLLFELDLPDKMHVYAPQVKSSYKPVSLTVDKADHLWAHPAEFPQPKQLHLDAINEIVPVFDRRVRIYQDITVSHRFRGKQIKINVTLSYQACDDKACYPPTSVPLSFTIDVERHDGKRVPKEIRRTGTPLN